MAARTYTDGSNQVGRMLHEARLLGLKRREIAAELGVSERTLRRWVAGSRDLTTQVHRQLAKLLMRQRL
jgi:plasmid maintenance system antidote protein VapI